MGLTVWSGLTLGSIYALVALGFLVTLVPTGVFNFAQGALILGGDYLTYYWFSSLGLSVGPAIVLDAVVGVMLGILCEVVCIRPLRGRSGRREVGSREIVTTVGMATGLVGVMGVLWGQAPLSVPFRGSNSVIHWPLGVVALPVQVIVVVVAVVAAVGLEIWFRATRMGQACLAVSEDRTAAMLRGVNVNLLSVCAFGAAGAMAGLAAYVTGPITYATPAIANTLALGGFVALALGGERSFIGAMFAALIVGVVSSVAAWYLGANYSDPAVLILLLLALGLRPSGVGGRSAVRRV